MQTDEEFIAELTRTFDRLDTRQRAHALFAMKALVAGECADELLDAVRHVAKTTPAERLRKR